jgi:hypothetical protein
MGNLSRETAAVLSPLIDNGYLPDTSEEETDVSTYLLGFKIHCLLSYSPSNRSTNGYELDVVIESENSSFWISSLAAFLTRQGLAPEIL